MGAKPGEADAFSARAAAEYQIPWQVGERNQAVFAEPELGWLRTEISKIGQNTFSTSPILPQNVNGYRPNPGLNRGIGAGC